MSKLFTLLTLLATSLLGTLSHPVTHFGATGAISQLSAESNVKSTIQTFETVQQTTLGKYQHIPETSFGAQYPSTYHVDEFLYPDGTRGYQVVTSHYENVQVLNATTSQMETVSVLKQSAVGYGEDAKNLTYEK